MAAAAAATTRSADMILCPDPSAHETGRSKLADHASTAALYVTHPERNTNQHDDVLDADGKLSTRGAATSLKYAKAQDLPSFPSSGLHAADSAGKAAMLARDYRMKDLWQPEMSAAGSRAALLAHKDGARLTLWEPSASADGLSAATLAMRSKNISTQPRPSSTSDSKHRALLAATSSIKARPRAESTPVATRAPPSDHDAMSAATRSHRPASTRSENHGAAPDGWDSEANQAARVTNIHMDPAMFGERPPVEIEQAEKKRQAALRASTLSMAKQMYEYQNRTVLGDRPATANDATSSARPSSAGPRDVKQKALQYIHLQDAAHKLAQERLAKVEKDFEPQRYREYYGYGEPDRRGSRKSLARLSVLTRSRKRASSDGDLDDSDDEAQAHRIRSQMSQLRSGVSAVDDKKRQDDRTRLLAAAEKRVHDRMHDMDEKVFLDTGKIPPAMMEEWESKARKRAQEEKETQAQHSGKTHVGGGKFVDQSEIEAIAHARLKPTLDEINASAEKRRARDQELKGEREEQERAKREEKDEQKRAKQERQAVAKKEKEEARTRKSEDKRKSRETKREEASAVTAAGTLGEVADKVKEDLGESGEVEDKPAKTKGLLSRLSRDTEEKRKSREAKRDGAGADAGATLGEVATRVKDEEQTAKIDEPKAVEPRKSGLFGRKSREARHNEEDIAAASTALGEVAEKVRKEPERDKQAPVDTKDRAKSGLLGRFGGRLRRDRKDDDHESEVTKRDDKSATAGATDALAGAAAGGLVTGEHTEKAKNEASTAYVADKPSDEANSGLPSQPVAGVSPENRIESVEDPDAAAVTAVLDRPDVERHYSQIGHSDEDIDTADEEAVQPRPSLGKQQAHAIAERVATSPVEPTEDVHQPLPMSEKLDEKLPEPAEAAAATQDPVAGAITTEDLQKNSTEVRHDADADAAVEELLSTPAAAPVSEPAPVAPSVPAPAPVNSHYARNPIFDAATHEGVAQYDEERRHEDSGSAPHESNVANAIGQRVQPDVNDQGELEEKRVEESTAPDGVENTLDPIASNVANTVDPRVQPKPQPAPAPEPEAANERAKEKRVAERSEANTAIPFGAATGASAPSPAGKTSPDDKKLSKIEPQQREEQKGIRGFLSKLRGKRKRQDQQPQHNKLHKPEKPVAADHSEKQEEEAKIVAQAAPVSNAAIIVAPVTPAAHPDDPLQERHADGNHTGNIGTDRPIDSSTATDDISPVSPSSFVRHEGERRDPDDVSSSGMEEDDIVRGRQGGGRKREPGRFGGVEKMTTQTEGEAKASGEAWGTAEKADDVDGNEGRSMPPPKPLLERQSLEAAGSTGRETKFKEEV